MSKAILVLEMPKNCYQCPYCECKDNYCVLCGESMETQGERQSWCPLKEMPKKKVPVFNPNDCDMEEEIKIIHEIEGYNRCLDEILGEEK